MMRIEIKTDRFEAKIPYERISSIKNMAILAQKVGIIYLLVALGYPHLLYLGGPVWDQTHDKFRVYYS